MANKCYIDKDEHRHWCPISEPYTGCDALLSALDQGWKLSSPYCQRSLWLFKERHVSIYYFELRRSGQLTCMAVINSPTVERFIQSHHLCISDIEPSPEDPPYSLIALKDNAAPEPVFMPDLIKR
jgi:hypothetical protein